MDEEMERLKQEIKRHINAKEATPDEIIEALKCGGNDEDLIITDQTKVKPFLKRLLEIMREKHPDW